MENEMLFKPGQLSVTEQDIDKINTILKESGVSLPVSYSGKRESWQLPVEEELLAGINAQRKRLQRRNLQLHRQSLDLSQSSNSYGGTSVTQARNVYADGDYLIGRLRKKWKRITTYLRNQKQVSSFSGTTWIDYYVKKEPGEECKVSSVYIPGNWGFFGRNEEYGNGGGSVMLFGSAVVAVLLWLLFGLLFFAWMLLAMGTGGGIHFIMLRVLLFCGIGAGVATWFQKKCKLWQQWRTDSRKVVEKFRDKEPRFCMEKFISIINSKMLRMVYADGTEEIGDIIGCDMSVFLRNHASVVNCEIINFWFTGFREDENYMYLDVTYRVALERDLGSVIGRNKETIMLQLARPLQGIMQADLYGDWSVVRVETHEKWVENK